VPADHAVWRNGRSRLLGSPPPSVAHAPISEFPDRLLQNAKKAGDWHQAISAGRFATARGIRISAGSSVKPWKLRRNVSFAAACASGSCGLAKWSKLAVFGYAHVPHLIPRQRRIDVTALPGAAARFAQAAAWLEALRRSVRAGRTSGRN
jgi:coproporphyrinogen III oxidase-like Fe-S oxidoreductase